MQTEGHTQPGKVVVTPGREWFEDWREPGDFLRKLETVSPTIEDVDHRANVNKWFREAKILGLFSVGVGAGSLRIIERDPPDGEVKLAGQILPIEIVEAFEPGRRPDREFKTGNRKRDVHFRDVPGALQKAVSKKEAHTNYPQGTILVVYLNMGEDYRSPPSDVLEAIKSICSLPSSKFNAICILWRCWLFGPAQFIKEGRVCIDWRLLED